MWPVNKVEIYFAIIGFVDCKWSNLNASSVLSWNEIKYLTSLLPIKNMKLTFGLDFDLRRIEVPRLIRLRMFRELSRDAVKFDLDIYIKYFYLTK